MNAALAAAEPAYAPYSGFRVGAALLTRGGAVHVGCNVENASYGLGTCAERTAVFAMVAAGASDRTVESVAVASPDVSPCFPCGACRQVLHEFGCATVYVRTDDGGIRPHTLAELLPHAFGPADLRR
jgi:cytidine deaminase